MTATHLAFSDESQYNTGRFRAIAAVSVDAGRVSEHSKSLARLISEAGCRELKWEKVRTARDREAVLACFRWLFQQLDSISCDVLMWDVEDARHSIRGRDDIENLHRMHHHLMKHVMTHRGSSHPSRWHLYPDEQTAVRWQQVSDFLDRKSMSPQNQRTLYDGHVGIRFGFKMNYVVEGISPSHSHEHGFIQIADLLAGMMVFSWKRIEVYEQWARESAGQMSLYGDDTPHLPSTGEREKCRVLDVFWREMKTRRMPVSLVSSRGLRTHNWHEPLNFWAYEPQTEKDKAPVRMKANVVRH